LLKLSMTSANGIVNSCEKEMSTMSTCEVNKDSDRR